MNTSPFLYNFAVTLAYGATLVGFVFGGTAASSYGGGYGTKREARIGALIAFVSPCLAVAMLCSGIHPHLPA